MGFVFLCLDVRFGGKWKIAAVRGNPSGLVALDIHLTQQITNWRHEIALPNVILAVCGSSGAKPVRID